MGELVAFSSDSVVYQLVPDKDVSWDMIIDAARRDGKAIYEYEGTLYELNVEDLDGAA